MSVQLTPKGTRGTNIPNLPSFTWRLIHPIITLMNRLRGGKILKLTTIGSKTGEQRTVPLRYFPDGKNRWLIVASLGGAAKHPAWYVNLSKNPGKVWIELDGEKIAVRANSVHGAEREKLWKQIVATAPGYGEYQTKTDREIPIVRLRRA